MIVTTDHELKIGVSQPRPAGLFEYEPYQTVVLESRPKDTFALFAAKIWS
jgi:hypothetical protein